jgi:hypothetical protein
MPPKPKRRKPKIRSHNKSYTEADSPLYKLTNRRRLASLLDTDLARLNVLKGNDHYRRFVSYDTGKARNIHEPNQILDPVHTRLASFLVRIAPPDYLHSGVKGRSNITNAKAHLGSTNLLVCDLQAFFDSTTRGQIFDFFYNVMQCSADVADLISHVACVDDHCPTGSRLSMPIAFYANRRMFSELEKLSIHQGISMTLYVDDLTFSGSRVNRQFLAKVRNIVLKYGHQLKAGKTKLFKPAAPKPITGAVVVGNELKPRNAHLKSLREDISRWHRGAEAGPVDSKLEPRMYGKMISLADIDPVFRERARSFRAEVARKKLVR